MNMKNIYSLILVIVLSGLFMQCDKDESFKNLCDSENGTPISNQIGRIYKETRSEPNFFYLGNSEISKKGGGYIPCNGLSAEFQIDGLAIVYSGIDKGTLPDTGDPNFGYIIITEIKKAE